MPEASPVNALLSWWSAVVGAAAAIGAAALLGTLVSNASVWWYMAKGLSLQQASAQSGQGLASPVALLSFAALCLAGVFGGYVSAAYGSSRPLLQGLVAGILSTSFFLVMSLNPSGQPSSGLETTIYLAAAICSGLLGGYVRKRRAA